MGHSKYKYCGDSDEIEGFEDLITKLLGSENNYKDEDCFDTRSSNCNYCKRNESMRYCGKSFPELNVYTGDHYDDVIDAILTYINEL